MATSRHTDRADREQARGTRLGSPTPGTADGLLPRGRPILASERRNVIRRILQRDGAVRVSELAPALGVSEETVRRDLEYLARAGLAERTYGGAVVTQSASPELPFARREAEHREEKERIARAALQFVREGDNIGMDASTTVLYLARAWPQDLQVTVLTNSVPIAVEMLKHPAVTVVCTGGIMREASWSFVGPLAERAVGSYHLDRVFMSCRGFTVERGPTESNELEVQVKRRLMEAAEQVIVLADSSKLGAAGFVSISPATAVQALVTDAGADPAYVERLRRLGIEVVLAE
ncbi:DeoR/GlpR family DNA-binding transcription regulator [Carboxydochorda subterranea]|uniref:DeoR/GlpR family DNA-binding transcription regulator n=1 Tax=Carboxydichorda subterranea TaxID=3109565 RepID=A0ABZ1BVU4_9FIRM|nr:DeoR/GlpR family DNA-binding transcription regulator [Limnochorda sp. L945t]WRP16799.1 DeoR/GlpR family DNA-binding transcription regulator [Limnochorda sp. L945t]